MSSYGRAYPFQDYGPIRSYTRTAAYAPRTILSAPVSPHEYIVEEPYRPINREYLVAPPPPPVAIDYETPHVIANLRADNAELMRQLEASRLEQSRLSRIVVERDTLAGQLSSLEVRYNEEVRRLRDDNVVLTRDLDSLELRLANYRQLEADALALEAQLRASQQRIIELEGLLGMSNSERQRAEELITQLRGDILYLKTDRDRLEALLREGQYKPVGNMRPMLGVEIKMLDDGVGGRDNVVVVHSITPGGPVETAGLRPEDVLQAWNGALLDNKQKFTRFLEESQIGSTITLDVWRAGKILRVPVSVGGTSATVGTRTRGKRIVSSKNTVN